MVVREIAVVKFAYFKIAKAIDFEYLVVYLWV